MSYKYIPTDEEPCNNKFKIYEVYQGMDKIVLNNERFVRQCAVIINNYT